MNGPTRAGVAAAVAVVAFLGVGGAVMALQDDSGDTSSPTTSTQEVQPVASIDPTSGSDAPTTTEAAAETPTTTAPAAAGTTTAAPSVPEDPTVTTIVTPDGVQYPDGYVAPEFRTPEQGGTHAPPSLAPPVPMRDDERTNGG
jgi:hypothetical protein